MAKGGTMVIDYTAVGDFLLPNIAYCDEALHFGRYSRLRQKFLKEYHGGVYSEMLLSGSLWEHLAEIESSYQARLERIVLTLAKSEGVTESSKALDQLEWVSKMNSIHSRAEEIVLAELIDPLPKIETPQWRFYYEQKKSKCRRTGTQGKNQRAVAGKQHQQHGRHPKSVQGDDCRIHGKRS